MSRPSKAVVDQFRAYGSAWEEEAGADGTLVPTAVIFLTNKECPFRCVMCDLWVHTLDARVSGGAIRRQIAHALAALPAARQVKLYNAGSFFDPEAIPPEDDVEIAAMLQPFERVVVESHPAFLRGAHGARCLRFRDALAGRLEVAVGLETAHPDVLARLDKQMTLEAFVGAAGFLRQHRIDLRVFILLQPPFMPEGEAVSWACRSLDLAADCGATASTVIPTRGGDGYTQACEERFTPPTLPPLERTIEYGLSRSNGRVFADLWDIDRFFGCACSPRRAERLRTMNREQRVVEAVTCECDAGAR